MHAGLLIFGNALALVAAWMSARAWFPARGPEERLLAVATGWATVVVCTMLLLGIVGQLHAGAALGSIAVVAVAAALAARGRHMRDVVAPEVAGAAVVPRLVLGVLGGFLVAAAVPVLHRLLVHVWTPHWDDFSYHAPMAAHWLQAERFVLGPASYHAYYGGNGELLSAWFMLPSKLDAYATLTGLYGMCLSALVAAALARALGAGLQGALVSAAFVLCSKPFLHQASTFAAVDLIGAALSGAALVFAVNSERDAPRGHAVARILYAGCCAGLATGCKITFAPIGVLACLIMLLRMRVSVVPSAKLALAFAGAALACGGYYSMRNIGLTSNPVFPAKLLFLDGPFDDRERLRTTLLFQLRTVDEATLAKAVTQLLDWPRALGFMILAGYASALVVLRPSQRQSPVASRTFAVLAAGGVFAALSLLGPFTGTVNDPDAALHIRMRFFLGFALLGPPLLAAFLDREPKLRSWGSCGLAAALSLLTPLDPLTSIACAALGVATSYASPLLDDKVGERLRRLAAPIGCVLIPAFAVLTIHLAKEPVQVAAMRKHVPAWNVLDMVPDGARMTWFSTFDGHKYYRAFGERLRLIPVPVEEDGRPFTFLHVLLKEALPALPEGAENPEPYTWRRTNERPRNWDAPMERQYELSRLVENLERQAIEYVFVMRRHKGNWPMQHDALEAAPGVERLHKTKNYALFRLLATQGER